MNYFNKVDTRVSESLQYIQEDVDGNWTLVFEDGEMKVLKGGGGLCCLGEGGIEHLTFQRV